MNTAPKYFVTFCKIAGLSPQKIQETWEAIWKKTLGDFFNWIINDLGITDEQGQKLLIFFEKVSSTDNNDVDLLWDLGQILDHQQTMMASKKYVELFEGYLDDFLISLKSKMSLEEREVINSYRKTQHGT